MTLQLKLGGKYRRRDGEVVKIVVRRDNRVYPWRSCKGDVYTDAGQWYVWADEAHWADLVEEIKDDDMKHFDLAAVDKLTALCSEGRSQVKQLVTEVVESLGGTVKAEVVPKVGQVWVSPGDDVYVINRAFNKYAAANLNGWGYWTFPSDDRSNPVAGLTYAAASVEEYYVQKMLRGEL